ncbi:tetratricopeptide repeat protein [Undibacterium sp. Ji49W]|uniref:tetratricopeptide repeat protein n=1 Tax=Undibacterium sp. Ji49W TaxID=3413040 RepID=UPI003BF33456
MKKVSRNDPCPCGSGKKYKQCCMAKHEAELADTAVQKASEQALISQYLAQGMALHREGQLEQAEQAYLQILQLAPANADALHLSGLIAHQRANYTSAISLISLSLQTNPNNAYAHNNLGAAFRENAQLAEALQCFKRASSLKADYAEAYNNTGNIYKDMGRLEEAIQSYRHALMLNRALAEPWNNLALIYQKQKNLAAALECAEQAAQLQPAYAEIHNTLGNIYKDAGQSEKALSSYRRAVELNPQQGNALHFIKVLSGEQSAQAPDSYVSKVFDDYAERFDQHLQQVLEYHIPVVIATELGKYRTASQEKWRLLDLGCGTGLVGKELAPMAASMVGVDLSEKMLLKAQSRQLYQRLIQSDLLTMTRQEASNSYDLVTAADVFVYIGRLDDIVADIARLLPVTGLFAFSVESADELPASDDSGYCLRPSGRYAHRTGYLQQLASQCGYHIVHMSPQTIRMENHQAIPGYVFIWRKLL